MNIFLILVLLHLPLYSSTASNQHDYGDALSKSILFFEGQRSGYLPTNQRMKWRGNSAITDGGKVDLKGGYYDAGDNVKFGFPLAFTSTMLAWSVVEFGQFMPPSELQNALSATRWVTDYLLKTLSTPNTIFVQVGEPIKDHNCWERPEDMDTERKVYKVEAPNPASDIAGETAAALAAASIAFRSSDKKYSDTLLQAAYKAFDYADTHRGAYSDNADVKEGACPFYCSYSGYKDELLWGAAWLRRATQNDYYLEYIVKNANTFSVGNANEFGWDDKHAGVNVLVSWELLIGKKYSVQSYKDRADSFMCTLIPETSSPHVEYSPGGLMYKQGGSNLQHATSISFLLLTYANYLEKSKSSIKCGNIWVDPTKLRKLAKSQVDYILGHNPKGMSYMVGYGKSYPQRIHHRGSSSPSIKDHPQFIACKEGTVYYNSSNPNPNVLVGAVVGGPQQNDLYEDDRADAVKSEPTTYINAPFVGVLAYMSSNTI